MGGIGLSGRTRPRGWRVGLVLVVCCALVASCHASDGPASEPTVADSQRPFPTGSAVASVAATTPQTSAEVVGYRFHVESGVTGVRAEWTVPTATGTAPTVYQMVGIQASSGDNWIGAGSTLTHLWYQCTTLEGGQEIGDMSSEVRAGDLVFASITMTKSEPETWAVDVEDVTSHSTTSKTIEFTSDKQFPVVMLWPRAASSSTTSTDDVPTFSPAPFYDAQVRTGAGWISAASLPSFKVSLVRGGQTLAEPSDLSTTSSFTVTRSN